MEFKKEVKTLFWMVAVFLFAYFLPLENNRFQEAS